MSGLNIHSFVVDIHSIFSSQMRGLNKIFIPKIILKTNKEYYLNEYF